MSGVEFLFMGLKAFFVVMFAMNVGVLLTWADRRQGSMIQDRVGPNRAVIWLPKPVAQGLAFGPAVLISFATVAFAYANKEDAVAKTGNAMMIISMAGV